MPRGLILFCSAHENGKAVAAAKLVSGNARMVQITSGNAMCSDYTAHESGLVASNSRGIVRDMVSMEIKKLVWYGMGSEEGKDQVVVKHLVKQGEDM